VIPGGFFYVIAACDNFGQDLRDCGQDFMIWGWIFVMILLSVLILSRICMISARIS